LTCWMSSGVRQKRMTAPLPVIAGGRGHNHRSAGCQKMSGG